MFSLSLPWWEFSLRALIVYIFLLVTLRLTGRRQIGQLSPFDFVLLFILGNAVQNSMNGGDNKEKITHDELNSILRRNGVNKVEDVKVAIVEGNGEISVIKN